MEQSCIKGLDSIPPTLRGCVLTIGNFDGVHRGHQQILRTARKLGDVEGDCVVGLIFEPPPEHILRPQDPPQRITPCETKTQLLLDAGADCVVIVETDRKLLEMSPRQFVREVVVRRFAPRHVVEGQNFFFGRGRSGRVRTLEEMSSESGFEVHVVDPVLVELPSGLQRISSSLVRGLILSGRVADAHKCLTRPFTLYQRVIPGSGVGRVLEFPTVNVDPAEQVVPPDGVYAGVGKIGSQQYPAAISIGNKPTFGPTGRVVEGFLVGATGDLYGKSLSLGFLEYLRDQKRFDNPEQLKAQIAKDVRRVREICG